MLTKDLIRIKKRGEKSFPQFLDLKNQGQQEFARSLLTTANESIGLSIGHLQQSFKNQVIEKEPKLTKGLFKVLSDACSSQPEGNDISSTRWLILEAAQSIRTESTWINPTDFLQRVADELSLSVESLQKSLYADLPDLQQVEKVPEWSPQDLLGRYNFALLQALFFRSEKLNLTCKKPSMPDLRRFGRALKFHKLLANGQRNSDGSWSFEISGPLTSHLDQSHVYGMHFVRMIPSLLRLPSFEVELNFNWQDRSTSFSFNETLAKNWQIDPSSSTYYPEDLDAVLESLKNELDDANQIETGQEMLTMPDGTTCIPDWTVVRREGGETIHIELFHRWHKDTFERRLRQLHDGNISQKLLVGACRSLTKQKGVERVLKNFPNWDKKFGFSFRDFPTAEQLEIALKHIFAD